jgi:ArsR family metal-binding transcriptional regulator
MDRVFGDIKTKKSEALRNETLSKQTLSEDTLSIKELNLKLIDEAIAAANSKRRMIGVWSPNIAAAMWYLKGTIPRFSISEVASHWIEEGLERDYPELVQKIREGIKK